MTQGSAFFFPSYYSVTFHQYWKGAGMNSESSSDTWASLGILLLLRGWVWVVCLSNKHESCTWRGQQQHGPLAGKSSSCWGFVFLFYAEISIWVGDLGTLSCAAPTFSLEEKTVIHSTIRKAQPSFHPPSPGGCCLTHILH